MVHGKVARKHMERSEPGVARGDPVSAFDLQETQKPGDTFGVEILDFQLVDRPPCILGHKLQQQQERISVASHRMQAQPALPRQEVLEEPYEIATQISRCGRFHGAPPSSILAHDRANRSPARSTTAGIQRR